MTENANADEVTRLRAEVEAAREAADRRLDKSIEWMERAESAEAALTRVRELSAWLREQGWTNVYETSVEFADLIDEALDAPDDEEWGFDGKPPHGWTCDCDECEDGA